MFVRVEKGWLSVRLDAIPANEKADKTDQMETDVGGGSWLRVHRVSPNTRLRHGWVTKRVGVCVCVGVAVRRGWHCCEFRCSGFRFVVVSGQGTNMLGLDL